jgi:hypothetical protein
MVGIMAGVGTVHGHGRESAARTGGSRSRWSRRRATVNRSDAWGVTRVRRGGTHGPAAPTPRDLSPVRSRPDGGRCWRRITSRHTMMKGITCAAAAGWLSWQVGPTRRCIPLHVGASGKAFFAYRVSLRGSWCRRSSAGDLIMEKGHQQ